MTMSTADRLAALERRVELLAEQVAELVAMAGDWRAQPPGYTYPRPIPAETLDPAGFCLHCGNPAHYRLQPHESTGAGTVTLAACTSCAAELVTRDGYRVIGHAAPS